MRSAEFVTARELYKEFLASPYYSEEADYLTLLRNVAEFVRAKKLGDAQSRSVLRKMAPLLRPEMESRSWANMRQADREFRRMFAVSPAFRPGDRVTTKFGASTQKVSGVVTDVDPKTHKVVVKDQEGRKFVIYAQMLAPITAKTESLLNELEFSRRIEYNKENPPPDLDLFRAFIKILYTAQDPQLQDVVDRANQSFMKFYGKGLTLAKLRSIAASNPLNGALWKDAVGKWAQRH